MADLFITSQNPNQDILEGYQCCLETAKHNSLSAPQIDNASYLACYNTANTPVGTHQVPNHAPLLFPPLAAANFITNQIFQAQPEYGVIVSLNPSTLSPANRQIVFTAGANMTTPSTLEVEYEICMKVVEPTTNEAGFSFALTEVNAQPSPPVFPNLSLMSSFWLNGATTTAANECIVKTGKIIYENFSNAKAVSLGCQPEGEVAARNILVRHINVKAKLVMPDPQTI